MWYGILQHIIRHVDEELRSGTVSTCAAEDGLWMDPLGVRTNTSESTRRNEAIMDLLPGQYQLANRYQIVTRRQIITDDRSLLNDCRYQATICS